MVGLFEEHIAAELEAKIRSKREIIRSLDRDAGNYERDKKVHERELDALFDQVQSRQQQDDRIFETSNKGYGHTQSGSSAKRAGDFDDHYNGASRSKRRNGPITHGMSSSQNMVGPFASRFVGARSQPRMTSNETSGTQDARRQRYGRAFAEQTPRDDDNHRGVRARYQDSVRRESSKHSLPTSESMAPSNKKQKTTNRNIPGRFMFSNASRVEPPSATPTFARSPPPSGEVVNNPSDDDNDSLASLFEDPFDELDSLYTGTLPKDWRKRLASDPTFTVANCLYRHPSPLGPRPEDPDYLPERLRGRDGKIIGKATNVAKDETDELDEEAKKRKELAKLFANITTEDETFPEDHEGTPEAFNVELMKSQLLGLDWLKKNEESDKKGGILADGMGLGKTLQAIALIVTRPSDDPKKKTTLVVVPLNVLEQWKEEIKTKIKDEYALDVMIYHGDKAKKMTFSELSEYDVILTNYETVRQEWSNSQDGKGYHASERDARVKKNGKKATPIEKQLSLLGNECEWYRVILDEAHQIKNHEAGRSKAACALKATYRLCLTGTPIQGNISELYGLIKFLRIKPYDDFKMFEKDISLPLNGNNEYSKRQATIKLQYLVKSILKQRTFATKINGEPIMKMPEIEIKMTKIPFSADHAAFYKPRHDEYLKSRVGPDEMARNQGAFHRMMAMLMRARQAASHPLLCRDFTPPTLLKTSATLRLARDFAQDHRSVIIRVRNIIQAGGVFSCQHCKDPTLTNPLFFPCGHYVCQSCFSIHIEKLACPIALCKGPLSRETTIDFPTLKRAHFGTMFTADGLKTGGVKDDYLEKHKDEADKEAGLRLPQLREVRKGHTGTEYKQFLDRQYAPSAKIQEILKILRAIRKKDKKEKTLIFSEWTSMLDLIECAIEKTKAYRYERYDGDAAPKYRNEALKRFKEDDKCTVLLISIGAGNMGLNLNAANNVILHEPHANPTVEDQAIGRAFRKGQTKKVVVHKLVMSGHNNVEEMTVEEVHMKKRGLTSMAMGAGNKVDFEDLTQEEIAALLGIDI